jgi:hypothetical protein
MLTIWSDSLKYVEKQIMEFDVQRDSGDLTKLECGSYLNSALDRQQQGGPVDLKELKEVGKMMVLTSVATTAIEMYLSSLPSTQNARSS